MCLQKLIGEKIVPIFFKIRYRIHDMDFEAAKEISLEWMKTMFKENIFNGMSIV